ncbi:MULTISPECIES: hypothetical protein [unclassified Roseateles]|uniref:hypothetical protein n=1 Tax=unclassified Roseateles TaxID=2626991 RepID=UPI0006FA9AC9|nr:MULTISPECIES: hypothetical protein [unclassified Roseateles]KQW42762.1 hypothetical protein ASC81_19065 [Pelomonas sp. Root405]KRA69439.1 hypothetical protein ASD88_19715 [Pelomonas sp. Root662]
MKRFISSAPLGLFSALVTAVGLVAAGTLSLPSEAFAAASPCDDRPALQQRLDDFDARWNASDAWGLTAQFAMDGSLGASGEVGRQAVYRQLIERLGRSQQPRQTRVLRASNVGQACLVDVMVRSGERQEAGLFLLAHNRDGGIVAMR